MNCVLRFLIPFAFVLSACGGDPNQSAIHPASEEARGIATLWWVMAAVYGLVFVITLVLGWMAVSRRRKSEARPPGGATRFIVIAGVVVPSILMLTMLVLSLRLSTRMRPPETAFTVEVTGYRWWWAVRYPGQGIVDANEIHIPVGVPVRLDLRSADVIHSFWVPSLHGKMDMFPDHLNRFWIQADRPGLYKGVCAEFCGDQHALMAINVIAMPPEEFATWTERRGVPPPVPENREGLDLFFSAGCAACHAIAGTGAIANLGPDLTHLAARRNLAASTIPNNAANLASWIATPHLLKPGSLMPPTDLSPENLTTLVDYLQTLR
jgi:cytochrome c oxidase subunit 2